MKRNFLYELILYELVYMKHNCSIYPTKDVLNNKKRKEKER